MLSKHQEKVAKFTYDGVRDLWNSLEESRDWPPIGWVHEVCGNPSLVVVGASESDGGETFAVIDVFQRRVLEEDEFPSSEIEKAGTTPIPGCPVRETAKDRRRKHRAARGNRPPAMGR